MNAQRGTAEQAARVRAAAGIAIMVVAAVVAATVAVVRHPLAPPDPVRGSRAIARGTDVDPESRKVVILATAENRECLASQGIDLDERLLRWEESLRALDIPVRRIARLDRWNDEILLLVSAVCISDEDLLEIDRRMREGAGVFVAGGIGTRAEDGAWLGWDRMHAFLGSSGLVEMDPDADEWLVVAREAPPGLDVEAGTRLRAGAGHPRMGLTGIPPAATWDEGAVDRDPAASAATLARGEGRLAWSGFDPWGAGGSARSGAHLEAEADRILEGLVDWCAGATEAAVDRWPGGAEAVLLVVVETDRQPMNAPFVDEALGAIGCAGTYPFTGARAFHDAPLVSDLARRHAVLCAGDGEGTFAGVPFGRQYARLRRATADLTRAAGRSVRGAVPPPEGWDSVTLRALAALGYRYVLEPSRARGALPEPLEFLDERGHRLLLLRLPDSGTRDAQLLAECNGDEAAVYQALRARLRSSLRENGIECVRVRTDLLGAPQRIAPFARFLDHASADRVWITSADSLALWWRGRHGLSLSVREEGEAYALDLSNGSDEAVPGCDLLVALPGATPAVAVEGAVHVAGPDARGVHRLRAGRIEPGRTLRILVTLPAS